MVWLFILFGPLYQVLNREAMHKIFTYVIFLLLLKHMPKFHLQYKYSVSLNMVMKIILLQAARLNSVSNRMKKIALEMRVFGYKNTSQLELDSFILFVSQARMKVQ